MIFILQFLRLFKGVLFLSRVSPFPAFPRHFEQKMWDGLKDGLETKGDKEAEKKNLDSKKGCGELVPPLRC